MKNLIYLFLAITISFTSPGCGNGKRAKELAFQKEDSLKKAGEQLVFESILYTYSEDTTKFLEELFSINYPFLGEKGTFVKVPSGERLEISLGGKIFSGRNRTTIYLLKVGNNFYTKNMPVLNSGKFKYSLVFDFKIEPLKSNWTRRELFPLLEKYELSIRAKEWFGNMLVLDWEDFRDNYERVLEYEIEPRGLWIIWIGKEPFIINQEGKCWLTRKESLERRKKQKEMLSGKVQTRFQGLPF